MARLLHRRGVFPPAGNFFPGEELFFRRSLHPTLSISTTFKTLPQLILPPPFLCLRVVPALICPAPRVLHCSALLNFPATGRLFLVPSYLHNHNFCHGKIFANAPKSFPSIHRGPCGGGRASLPSGGALPPLQFTSTHTHEKTNGILGNLSKL